MREVQVERFGGGNIMYIKKIVGDANESWGNRSEVTITLGKVDYYTLQVLSYFAKHQLYFDLNKYQID